VAALLILVYHVYQYMRHGPGARFPLEGTPWHVVFVGLDSFVGLFFVLSAFLLGLPYAQAALAGTEPVSARAFLSRRVVRIVPLYLVAILLVWSARNRTLPGDWRDLLEHLTFTQVFDDKRIFYTIGPAWSLAVEVHFYLLLALLGPAACAWCRRVRPGYRRVVRLLVPVVVLAAAGLAWKLVCWYVLRVPEGRWWVWFSLPAKVDVFALGLLLAVAVAAGRDRRPRTGWRGGMAVLGVLTLAFCFATRAAEPMPQLYFHTGTAVGFVLLLAASVFGSPDRPLLGSRALTWLGLVSYSLYLWHEPVMLALAGHHLFPVPDSRYGFPVGVVVLGVAASLAAWLSYWIVEYPTGKLRRTR
jgi:peptidoglycan/LPS O-acetylase OafA/YrhL